MNVHDTELRSARLLLRPFRAGDVDDVFECASDPIVMAMAGWPPHRTPFDSMEYIQRCVASPWAPITFAIEYLTDRRVVGMADLRVIGSFRRRGEIGYFLARAYWGLGILHEAGPLILDFAFSTLGLRRVQAVCEVSNQRSVRTMERLGMTREQTMRDTVRGEDRRPRDFFLYSISRRDWRRSHAASSARA